MKIHRILSCLGVVAGLLLLAAGQAPAQFSGDPGFDPGKLKEINQNLAEAVKRKEIPGVVVWLERKGKLTKVDESKLYDEIPVAVARFSRHLKLDQMVQLRWPVS